MSDHAVPDYNLAIAEMLDRLAFRIRTGTPPFELWQEADRIKRVMKDGTNRPQL